MYIQIASFIFNLFKNKSVFWLVVITASLSAVGAFYIYFKSLKAELENVKQENTIIRQANENLKNVNDELIKRHEQELKALSKIETQKAEVKEQIKVIDKIIYKQIENGNNDLINLFNITLDELFNEPKKETK